jgi:signal transduction protein with GAF and PtsI domain
MWKGYTQGAPMDKDEVCGLGKVLEDPHDKMDEIQKQIDDVVEKMKDIFSQLQQDNVKLTKDMLDLQRRIDEDLNEYNNVNKSIEERQTAQTTINSMLSDSHLVVLKENYKYTFFSVVAIGALIIAMSVGKKMT